MNWLIRWSGLRTTNLCGAVPANGSNLWHRTVDSRFIRLISPIRVPTCARLAASVDWLGIYHHSWFKMIPRQVREAQKQQNKDGNDWLDEDLASLPAILYRRRDLINPFVYFLFLFPFSMFSFFCHFLFRDCAASSAGRRREPPERE